MKFYPQLNSISSRVFYAEVRHGYGFIYEPPGIYISSRRRVCSFYLVVKFELINVAKRPPVGYVSFVYESCDVFLVLYWMALCHSYCVFLTFSFMYRLCIDSLIFVLIFKCLPVPFLD